MKRLSTVVFFIVLAAGVVYSQTKPISKNKKLRPLHRSEQEQDSRADEETKMPQLPDYSGWKLIKEYKKDFLYMGKPVVLSSALFQKGNEDVCIYYYPGTDEPWLAVYQKGELIRSIVNKRKKPYKIWRTFFYEADRKEDGWILIKEMEHFGDHLEIFKEKYSLEPISEEKPDN